MKKILTASLITLAMAMTGCASKPVPMPVDTNPSEALQFARAMEMRQITDAGDNYVIYNKLVNGGRILPLENPVRAGEVAKTQRSGAGTADVVGGLAIKDPFIALTGFLTAKRPQPYTDGVVLFGSWAGGDREVDQSQMFEAFKTFAPKMAGFNEYELCGQDKSWSWFSLSKAKETGHLPKPPVLVSPEEYRSGYASACFFYLAAKKENMPLMKELSVALGAKRALFVPASQEHAPYVFYNGKVLEFKN
ncbi:hypothetical protein [Providencia rettgeri]|uniref:hypothetical protein n=1 Tax=Providencia rettgeri TaxID=587 RepID=UPI0011839661|nr:hypothetical protein [Providencia rettgeri]